MTMSLVFLETWNRDMSMRQIAIVNVVDLPQVSNKVDCLR